MREFVKGFKDRKGTNVTKKVINVLERTDHANGQMTLKGTINREDTGVIEEGTRLDAESMNNAVLDLIYNELYGLDFGNEPYCREYIGVELIDDMYNIYFTGPRLYGVVESNNYFDIEVSNQENRIKVVLGSKSALSEVDYELNVEYYINLYSDAACTHFVTRVKRCINYIPSSTSSND